MRRGTLIGIAAGGATFIISGGNLPLAMGVGFGARGFVNSLDDGNSLGQAAFDGVGHFCMGYVGGYYLRAGSAIAAPFLANMLSSNPAAVAEEENAATLCLAPSPGYNPWSGDIVSEVVQSPTVAYRVFGGDAGRIGGWLSPVLPQAASAARLGLALPPGNTSEYYCEVVIPAGTRYQIGTAAAVDAWGEPGGMKQILLLDRIPMTCFGPPQPFR